LEVSEIAFVTSDRSTRHGDADVIAFCFTYKLFLFRRTQTAVDEISKEKNGVQQFIGDR